MSPRLLVLPAALLATLLATLLALPLQAAEIDLELGGAIQHLASDSADALSDDAQLGGMSLRAGFGVAPDVFAEIEWFQFGETAVLFQSTGTRLDGDVVTLGARVRDKWRPWLEPWARFGAGASWTDVEVLEQQGRFTGGETVPHAQVGVGFDLQTPRRSSARAGGLPPDLVMGLSFELGWLHVFGQDVVLQSRRPAGGVQRAELDLGSMTLTGLVTRLALFVRL